MDENNETQLREYIVTCISMEEMELVCNELETLGGNEAIPDRIVPVYRRRSLSQNTHYMLTVSEAEALAQDIRILAVTPVFLREGGIKLSSYTQSGTFTKSPYTDAMDPNYRNWALLRCIEGVQRTSWGSDNTKNQTATITVGPTGKNVDVIIMDGICGVPNHPEFAVNADGSGGSRYIQYDWHQLNSVTNSVINNTTDTAIYDAGGLFNTVNYFLCSGTGISSVTGVKSNLIQISTTGTGSGATFNITKATGTNYSDSLVITDVIVVSNGTGYKINDQIKISGVDLGGTSPLNDLTITIQTHFLTTGYSYSGDTKVNDATHGAHTTGTVAGNTCGWARDANIYQIGPLGQQGISSSIVWDYVRAFHRNKPINPNTGRKNPTICNCSFGSAYEWPDYSLTLFPVNLYPIVQVYRRGIYSAPNGSAPNYATMTSAQLTSNGIYNTTRGGVIYATVPYWDVGEQADVAGAINDGIIIVAAAGNESFFVDKPTGLDYNNAFIAGYGSPSNFYNFYLHRGCGMSQTPGVITVGSVDSTATEIKAYYSNCGPRVDIYAPGTWIVSSYSIGTSVGYGTPSADSRNSNYYIGREIGTSMAAPQVTGVLACLLELYPDMTPEKASSLITTYAKPAQLNDSGGTSPSWTSNLTSLQGGPNKYLYLPKERPSTGELYPKQNYKVRPTSGVLYPRRNIKLR